VGNMVNTWYILQLQLNAFQSNASTTIWIFFDPYDILSIFMSVLPHRYPDNFWPHEQCANPDLIRYVIPICSWALSPLTYYLCTSEPLVFGDVENVD